MVDTQIRPSDVTKFPIIDAFLSIPREKFVPDGKREAAYIGENFQIGQSRVILDPRTLAKLLEALDVQKDELVLDIGTGSGCILVSLLIELPNSIGVGIDISRKAIEIARKNALLYKVENRIKFLTKSIIKLHNCKFDLLVSNPPYIDKKKIRNLDDGIKKFEPLVAESKL